MANEKQNNTQRVQSVQLLPKQVNTIYFKDTKPNHVHINSYDPGNLYFTFKGIPSPKRYDMLVPGQSDNIWAQQNGVTQCYIYNDSSTVVSAVITSFEDTFSPAILAKATVNVSGAGGIATNVTIGGYTAPLPAGDNSIGRVKVTEMPVQVIKMDSLPTGTNNIGSVNVAKMPPLPAGDSTIGKVGVVGGVTIDSMPPVQITNDPVKNTHHTFEAEVSTSLVTFDLLGETITTINHITNDGISDMFVSFDDVLPTAAPTNGKNGVFRLKPGEVVENMSRRCFKVHVIRQVGSGPVRFMGV